MAHVQLPAIEDTPDSSVRSSADVMKARRANTVPNQLSKSYQIPGLSYGLPIPRRYEQTRPVLLQNLTHRKILDFGEFIHKQTLYSADNDKAQAVEEAIAGTWEEANKVKDKAVKDAVDLVQIQNERQLKRLSRQHDKAIKEETLRVETIMQSKMREALEEQKMVAEKRLKEEIEKTKRECALELRNAVAAARKEEQEEAAIQKAKVLSDAAKELEAVKDKLNKEREIALTSLEKDLEEKRITEVESTKRSLEEVKIKQIKQLEEEHKKVVESIKMDISAESSKIEERDLVINRLQQKRQQLYDELVKVHADYEYFINRHPYFDPGQTNYLLPSFAADSHIENPQQDRTVMKYVNKN